MKKLFACANGGTRFSGTAILIMAVAVFSLMACAGNPIIPDEPKYQSVSVYADPNGGMCFPPEELRKLFLNIKALKEYSDKLKALLEKK